MLQRTRGEVSRMCKALPFATALSRSQHACQHRNLNRWLFLIYSARQENASSLTAVVETAAAPSSPALLVLGVGGVGVTMAQILGPSTAHNRANRAVEDVYQKKTQLEHILLRPDTYIGSIEHQQQTLWVHDGEKMVSKSVSFVPGLYKIFDEILVNAADNKVRDATMDTVRVDVDEVRALLTSLMLVPVPVPLSSLLFGK